jgi:hypothetical protein
MLLAHVWKSALVCGAALPARLAQPGVTQSCRSSERQKGREVCLRLPLPRLMMVLPGPGVVTAPPASQLPVLASSVHLETAPSFTQQLHLRNNGNSDNFPQSVIMPFRIVSLSNFTPALSQLFESPWSE